MRKCPKCGKWTLDFDDYFGRFRCFSPQCGWIPASSAEREIKLLATNRRPQALVEMVDESGLRLSSAYDFENDALVFDFGLAEPTFDLPEGDGRMLWKIGHRTASVSGFVILGARELGVSGVRIDIVARKEDIERSLRSLPEIVAYGRATKILVERVEVTANVSSYSVSPLAPKIRNAVREALSKLREILPQHASAEETTAPA